MRQVQTMMSCGTTLSMFLNIPVSRWTAILSVRPLQPGGRTDAFWYVNLAVRQQLMNRRLSATLSFRDVFNSARYVSKIITSDLQSITRIRPSYPLITLTLSYTFNNFKAKGSQKRKIMICLKERTTK